MRHSLLITLMTAGILVGGFLACQTNDLPAVQSGSFVLTFDNMVGSEDLKLNTGTYTNSTGEQFSVSLLNYFVSNIRLKRADGSEYVVPQDSSYFLVKETDTASQRVVLNQVPAGDYVGVSFLIGVDSLRSTMGIDRRKGVLEPAGAHNGGMYWDWNSGYIFFKLEGTSPQAPTGPTGGKGFIYHVGFFGGYETKTINNLRTATLSFGSDVAQVAPAKTPSVTIKADVLNVFNGREPVSIAKNPNVMVSPYSATIANNYVGMFQYKQLQTN